MDPIRGAGIAHTKTTIFETIGKEHNIPPLRMRVHLGATEPILATREIRLETGYTLLRKVDPI